MTAKVADEGRPGQRDLHRPVRLSNVDPPSGYTITGEGKGGAAGFAKAAPSGLGDGGDDTLLHLHVKAQVGGKLAQIGGRL